MSMYDLVTKDEAVQIHAVALAGEAGNMTKSVVKGGTVKMNLPLVSHSAFGLAGCPGPVCNAPYGLADGSEPVVLGGGRRIQGRTLLDSRPMTERRES